MADRVGGTHRTAGGAGDLADVSLGHLSTALTRAQRRLRFSTAAQLIDWAGSFAASGTPQAVLAAQTIAEAHRAAGNREGYIFWQQRTHDLLSGSTEPNAERFAAERLTGAGEPYRARPFAASRNWASVAIMGTPWLR